MTTLSLTGVCAARYKPQGRRPYNEYRGLESAIDLGYAQKVWIGGTAKWQYQLTKKGEQAYELYRDLSKKHEFDNVARAINRFEQGAAPTVPKKRSRLKDKIRRHLDNIEIEGTYITGRLKSRTSDDNDEHRPVLHDDGTFTCTCKAGSFSKRCWAVDRLADYALKHQVFDKPSTLKPTYNLSDASL